MQPAALAVRSALNEPTGTARCPLSLRPNTRQTDSDADQHAAPEAYLALGSQSLTGSLARMV